MQEQILISQKHGKRRHYIQPVGASPRAREFLQAKHLQHLPISFSENDFNFKACFAREVPLPLIHYLICGSTYEVRPVVPVHHLGSCEHGQHAGSQRLQVSGPGHAGGHGGLPSPVKWRAGNASPFRTAYTQLPAAAQPTPPPIAQSRAAIGRRWSRAARLPGRSVGIGGGGGGRSLTIARWLPAGCRARPWRPRSWAGSAG